MNPEDRKTAEQMKAEAPQDGARKLTICPQCGHIRFYATNTYRLVNGVKRRLRKCWECGFAQNETVPEPIQDQ
jgi:hypothetical protein